MIHVLFPRFMTSRLLVLLGLKAFLITLIILYVGIGLGPDEAQYWTWSQALDWGYYSKPPGIAWQIWLGTRLVGQTELGVRAVTILLAIGQAFFVYRLALRSDLRPQTSFWCGLLMAFCPLGLIGSLFAITDGGLLLCWTGACFTVVSALYHKRESSPFLVGVWILLGALFKWPIYLFGFFSLLLGIGIFPLKRNKKS